MAKIDRVVNDVLNARKARDEYVPGYVSIGAYVDESGECFVQQSDYDRSDINLIVERFVRTGVLESVNRTQGQYGDFSEVTDYHSALLQVQQAQESFMTLPAQVRAEFANDPGKFLDFVSDEANMDKMAEMGLLNDEAMARYAERKAQEGAKDAPGGATP